jgi:choline dehydrogenase-like flavoprotein
MTTVALAGCAGAPSALAPKGRAAAEIANLWWLLLVMGVLVYAGVMGLFVWCLVRHGRETSRLSEREYAPEFNGAGHVIGTYRMGNDPRSSVVDHEQRAYDHPNLFLLGSGVFPTAGTANPTLTIAALSLWAAQTIRRDLAAMA